MTSDCLDSKLNFFSNSNFGYSQGVVNVDDGIWRLFGVLPEVLGMLLWMGTHMLIFEFVTGCLVF